MTRQIRHRHVAPAHFRGTVSCTLAGPRSCIYGHRGDVCFSRVPPMAHAHTTDKRFNDGAATACGWQLNWRGRRDVAENRVQNARVYRWKMRTRTQYTRPCPSDQRVSATSECQRDFRISFVVVFFSSRTFRVYIWVFWSFTISGSTIYDNVSQLSYLL